MAAFLERTLAILAYAYPAIVFSYFVIATAVAACALHTQSAEQQKRGTRIRYAFLRALFAFVTITYVVEALILVIDGITNGPWPSDKILVGRLFSIVVFAVQLSQLLDHAHPVWYPFHGAWLLALAAEVATVVIAALIVSRPQIGLQQVSQLALSGIRVLLLAMLLAGSTQASEKGSDEERQGLIPKNATSNANGQTAYGSAGDSSPNSESDDEAEDEWRSRYDRQKQGLADRLKESGSWVQYAKGYAVLLPYLWPARSLPLQLRVIGVLGCLFLTNAINVLVPRQTAIIIDSLAGQGHSNPWSAVAVFIFLRILDSQIGIALLQEWFMTPLQYYSKEQMTRAIFTHIMHLSADFHDSKTSSDMQTAIYGGASIFDILEQIFLYAGPMAVDLIVAIAYLSTVFGPYEGFITMATGVAFLLLTGRLIDSSRQTTKARRSARYREHFLRYAGFTGWHTIAAFNQVEYESNRHADAVASRYTLEQKYSFGWQVSVGVQSTALTCGFAASAFLAVARIRAGQASSGQFAMLLMYWSQLVGPLQFITSIGKRLSDNFIEAEHTLSIMRTKPSVENKAAARPLKFQKGEVDFREVCFSYDGKKQILNNISLSVPAGQTVAFVGATGAGKSTMLRLLDRFYDVTSGSICIDGQDLREVDLHSLRDRIGVVPQDPILFDDTIINNVRYGRITASDEEVYEACRAACIHDKIESFTHGYESRVGERGIKLSGGELQRVAIARAILKKPDLVLLDEATSAVDTETEYSIQQSLKELCKGRTTFVVAHRLSTIMNADCIVVVDNGQILEKGSHEELISRGGKYASLWAKQVFLKPKDPVKEEDGLVSGEVINDLTPDQNAAELAKVDSATATDETNGNAKVDNEQAS